MKSQKQKRFGTPVSNKLDETFVEHLNVCVEYGNDCSLLQHLDVWATSNQGDTTRALLYGVIASPRDPPTTPKDTSGP